MRDVDVQSVDGGILDEEMRLVWLENCSNDEERHEEGNDVVAQAPAEPLGPLHPPLQSNIELFHDGNPNNQ